MNKVFIGGSRHVTHLNSEITKQLDSIIEKGYSVLIGDANGVDKAVQTYLRDRRYDNVEVFCTENACRNNIGCWEVRSIPSGSKRRDAQFYSAKDRIMAQEASLGFMIWDGKSVGTMLNVFRLTLQQKKAVLYVVPQADMRILRNAVDWDQFVHRCSTDVVEQIEKRLANEPSGRREYVNSQAALSF